MKERIKSITEALSMQPRTLSVEEKPCAISPESSIQRIDRVQYEQYEYAYDGFNFEGKRLFRYLEKSVNVHFFVD
ncbi:MAG TPA: hypothetical protein ENH82_08915 [bacterium]|nr:hypothetical protein [bacterium]